MSNLTLQVKNYLNAPYTRIVVPHEAGGFVAEMLEFEGCYADGTTAAQALRNLERNAADWIEDRLESKLFIPEPTGGSAMSMSGRFALRLPRTLHYKAARYAELEGISLNTFIVNSLAGSVGMLDFIERYASPFLEKRMSEITHRVLIEIKGTISIEQAPDNLWPTTITASNRPLLTS
ncbi:MAG: type II toxin-antitoxin system HicB family antitoxin [Chloracidobacterium sp.]|nr:type II toxin-antitoxin system HicB family antitoxin [Chloracidobacterium sp.]